MTSMLNTAAAPDNSAPSSAPPTEAALRRRLGDILVERGTLTRAALDSAIKRQQRQQNDPGTRRLRLGALLVDLGLVDEHEVAQALGELLEKQVVDPRTVEIDLAFAQLIPRASAERDRLLILGSGPAGIRIVAADPTDVVALDDVRRATGMARLEISIATPSVVQELIQRVWAISEQTTPVSELLIEDAEPAPEDDIAVADAPTVRLADSILADAARSRASDVHIEPQAAGVRIRYRVDGMLRDAMTLPRTAGRPLVSRLKIVANMDISERRVPQDGRLRLTIDGQQVDARASSLPSLHGEKLVIRLLPGSQSLQTLDTLGLDEEQRGVLIRALTASQGLILITGPTGSGKTNTLYAAINAATTPERNVVTLEDPIEIELPGITQVPVDERSGMTFTRGLRAILRQDPDVVLVGEVRDPETAELTLRAALTGHLVLTTLHTNGALAALPRLVDMGVPAYLVGSALSVIVAQRLVRSTCTECLEPYEPDEATLLALDVERGELEDAQPARGRGCPRCTQTGFYGRTGVFEVLEVTPELRRALMTGTTEVALQPLVAAQGFRDLRSQALALAGHGVTTYEEVLRVTRAAG